MRNKFFGFAIIAVAFYATYAYAGDVKSIVPELTRIASSPEIIEAVKEQNAKGVTLETIKALDNEWKSAEKATGFMKTFTQNSAAKYLLSIEKSKPYFIEFILTDNQGANVAITSMTSDFWQGDEPKFTRAYANGAGNVYIARPQKDKSTGEIISQVSVPVMSGGVAIGTLTVGVRANKI